MLLSSNETLAEALIPLMRQPLRVEELRAAPSIAERGVTIQAIYKALRFLVAEGIVLKHKETYVTSLEWLAKLADLSQATTMLTPQPGSSFRYTFTSFTQVESYWKQVLHTLPTEMTQAPFFAYLPHNFWHFIENRRDSEERFYRSFLEEQRHGYIVHGGTTTGDLTDKQSFKNEFLHINTIAYPRLRRTDHLAIMGDLITITHLSKATANAIDQAYIKCTTPAALEATLHAVLSRPTRVIITLSNNKAKAAGLRRVLSKDFYLYEEDSIE